MSSAAEVTSSSVLSVFVDKRDPMENHFRWDIIKKFIYLAYTYSSSEMSFDVFSRIWGGRRNIFQIIVLQVFVGMPYLYMDFFLKQYSRKMDTNHLLNPLLRGITYGLFVLSGLWMLKIASQESDAFRFFISSFSERPPWTECTNKARRILSSLNITRCVAIAPILCECEHNDKFVPVNYNVTSAYANTLVYFQFNDRTVMTTKFFVAVVVWGFTFFLSTMNEEALLKYFKISFITSTLGSLVILIYLIISTSMHTVTEAFVTLFVLDKDDTYDQALESIGHVYGIGFLGPYDLGTMSPFTMVDNCVVIYTMCYIVLALVRSWIVQIMFNYLKDCVSVNEDALSLKDVLYGVLPLSSEFFYANRMFVFYLYFTLLISSTINLAMLTLSMSRLLSNEFRSVKYIYLVGVVCSSEFILETLAFVWVEDPTTILQSIHHTLRITAVFLSGCKAAIIMWIYGVDRFSTDIQYWLQFHPTKFWKGTWLLLPIILWIFSITRLRLFLSEFELHKYSGHTMAWICLTIFFVAIFQIRTIAKFLSANNIAGVFVASPKFGPPDYEDRKRRRKFNVMAQQRLCHHYLYDELIECSHDEPRERGASLILLSRAVSEASLLEDQSRARYSVEMDVNT